MNHRVPSGWQFAEHETCPFIDKHYMNYIDLLSKNGDFP